jgi:undecaprenyl pyrophosphate phosphatase UppP
VTHFLIMILFAALVAVVFGVLGKETPRARLIYGAKVFGEFTVIGLAIAWALYFLPF